MFSGLVLGLVAIACAYPTSGGHAVVVGVLVGVVAFAANALAICLTASTAHVRAVRRANQSG